MSSTFHRRPVSLLWICSWNLEDIAFHLSLTMCLFEFRNIAGVGVAGAAHRKSGGKGGCLRCTVKVFCNSLQAAVNVLSHS